MSVRIFKKNFNEHKIANQVARRSCTRLHFKKLEARTVSMIYRVDSFHNKERIPHKNFILYIFFTIQFYCHNKMTECAPYCPRRALSGKVYFSRKDSPSSMLLSKVSSHCVLERFLTKPSDKEPPNYNWQRGAVMKISLFSILSS